MSVTMKPYRRSFRGFSILVFVPVCTFFVVLREIWMIEQTQSRSWTRTLLQLQQEDVYGAKWNPCMFRTQACCLKDYTFQAVSSKDCHSRISSIGKGDYFRWEELLIQVWQIMESRCCYHLRRIQEVTPIAKTISSSLECMPYPWKKGLQSILRSLKWIPMNNIQ